MMEGENSCNCKMCDCMKNHPRCKKFLRIVLAIIIAIIVVEAFDCDRRDTEQKDTIVVAGKGELTVKPDIATISFSVMEENMDVSKASDAVNKKIAKIMDVLKADSVDEKDIKTTDYNIYPRYDYTSAQIYPYRGTQVLAGYDVTQSITVKIRDLSKAGKIITDLGTLGVTNMSGLSFTEDKYDELVKEARDQAIAQARTEAKKLAKALGVRLGKIVGYSEGANYPTYYKSAVMDSSMGMGGATEAVIPTGENKITSSVSVTYEIK